MLKMKRSGADSKQSQSGRPDGRAGTPGAVVLHIDDDPNDTELLRAAVRKASVPFLLQNVEDGEQAIAYLNGAGPYADRQRYPAPALILLDLKMPRATGFEVLVWIRNHSQFRQVPVVVLSGSELKDDIQRAYAAGANSYLIKPLGFDTLVRLVVGLNALVGRTTGCPVR